MAVLIIDRASLVADLHTVAGQVEPDAEGSIWFEVLGIKISPDGHSLRVDGRLLDI